MVAPEWQGRGLGSALQRRLQEYASARGVRGFTAEILARNARMMRLANGARGSVTTSKEEGEAHVTILFADGEPGSGGGFVTTAADPSPRLWSASRPKPAREGGVAHLLPLPLREGLGEG